MTDVDPELDTGLEPEVDAGSEFSDNPADDGSFDASGLEADDTLYTVKVNGEDRQVSLDELRNGYQMQSDYTRKTQELAAERTRLGQAARIAEALASDPEQTLRTLAEAYRVSLVEDSSQFDEYGDLVQADPMVERLAALESQLQEQQDAQRRTALNSEIESVRAEYGEFDVDEVLQHAIQIGTGSVAVAYRDLNYTRMVESQRAAEVRDSKVAAKRQAGAVVHQGGSRKAAAQGSPAVRTIRDAFLAAKEHHLAN